MTRAARIGLAVYFLLIAAVVALANLGALPAFFSFINSIPLGDKIGHFVLMGVLALLADLALGRRDVRRVPLGPAIVVVLVTIEEITQLAMPATRSFDLVDYGADLLGIAAFVTLGRAIAMRRSESPAADG